MRQTTPKTFKKTNSFQLPPLNRKKKIQNLINPLVTKSQSFLQPLYEKKFEFLTQYEYISKINKNINDLSTFFNISTGLALNLLIKAQYNIEQCNALVIDYKQNDGSSVNTFHLHKISESLLDFECPVCFQNFSYKEMLNLCCEHKICKRCYYEYIMSIMKNEGIFCFFKTCPQEACKVNYFVFFHDF